MTTKLSMLFQPLRLLLRVKDVFLGLGLTVTEINSEKENNKN